jgi:HEAT repeat protein
MTLTNPLPPFGKRLTEPWRVAWGTTPPPAVPRVGDVTAKWAPVPVWSSRKVLGILPMTKNGSIIRSSAIEILSNALIDPSWDLRKTIVDLLEKAGWTPTASDHRAITALVHFNYDAAVAEGQAAFEPLVQRLEQPGANEKPILDALTAIGGEQVADYFISILPRLVERTIPDRVNRNFSFEQKAKERVRSVLHALSKVGDQHATDYLVAACTDPPMYLLIGSDVGTYLGERRFESAVQRLCESLANDALSLSHRCHIAAALGTIGDVRAVAPVKEFFAKLRIEIPSVGVGQNDASKGGIYIAKAAQALINLKETDNAYLIAYVIDLLRAPHSGNGTELTEGVRLAGQIPNQRITDILIELLSSGEHLRPSIASALNRRAWAPSFEQRVAMATATSGLGGLQRT